MALQRLGPRLITLCKSVAFDVVTPKTTQKRREERKMIGEGLSAKNVFQYLRPKQVDALSDASSAFTCKAGDFLYRKGMETSHVYVVLKGQVALRLTGKDGIPVDIDRLGTGSMFGSCVSANLDKHSVDAECIEDATLLKIDKRVFKKLMDDDPLMGYAIQSRISEIYFKRYVDTMAKL